MYKWSRNLAWNHNNATGLFNDVTNPNDCQLSWYASWGKPVLKLPNMEGSCRAWLHGISDTGMPTVHFVGAYVNIWWTFQVADVPKDRFAYSTESYAPSYYGLLVLHVYIIMIVLYLTVRPLTGTHVPVNPLFQNWPYLFLMRGRPSTCTCICCILQKKSVLKYYHYHPGVHGQRLWVKPRKLCSVWSIMALVVLKYTFITNNLLDEVNEGGLTQHRVTRTSPPSLAHRADHLTGRCQGSPPDSAVLENKESTLA